MNEFRIRRGKVRDPAGAEFEGWLVIDTQALPETHETIAAMILDGDSGGALVRAMLAAGASSE